MTDWPGEPSTLPGHLPRGPSPWSAGARAGWHTARGAEGEREREKPAEKRGAQRREGKHERRVWGRLGEEGWEERPGAREAGKWEARAAPEGNTMEATETHVGNSAANNRTASAREPGP